MQPSGNNRIRGLERDPRKLEQLYQEGRADMEKRLPEFQDYLNA
jgi:predicted patatin/cPLA2 family phospholipase